MRRIRKFGAVNLTPYIRRGQARDLRDRFRVYVFQIRRHHPAVERIESPVQGEQAGERLQVVRDGFTSSARACSSCSDSAGVEKGLQIPPALPA